MQLFGQTKQREWYTGRGQCMHRPKWVERAPCVCNQDTSGWLSYGKRKWLYLEAEAEPRGAL